jgi:hypothetical protein
MADDSGADLSDGVLSVSSGSGDGDRAPVVRDIFEADKVKVRETEQITEPGRENKGSGDRFGELEQITEPASKLRKHETFQFTEPPQQNTEPGNSEFTELGQEINADAALAPERRLWNLETYGDRHGKRRLRRSLRFVKKPCRIELGQVTPEFESELRSRPGRGRWAASRTDAELLKRFAELVAKSVKRDKRAGRKRPSLSKKRRAGNIADGRPPVPPPSGDTRWPDMPDVLM